MTDTPPVTLDDVRDAAAQIKGVAHRTPVLRSRTLDALGPFATADLNTRGGIERHAELLGPAYARMGAERGQDDPWTPDLVARVASEVHAILPPEDWADHVTRRDRALMRLEQARRADPESFTGFTRAD